MAKRVVKRERLDDRTTATPRRSTPEHPTLLDCIDDPRLFKPWFKDAQTWAAWFAFIAALFALPMTPDQLAIYRECTGRKEAPSKPAKAGWLICGRRAGKSFILALCAVFLAAFHDYRQYLTPGERGTVFVIATDRKQARTILRYIRALLTRVKMLSLMVEREWQEGFDLNNSVTIEVATASFKSTRGFTLVSVLLDEVAFFSSEESSSPDEEILRALRPGLLTIPNSMILAASSPYAKKGVLFNAYREHYGKEHDSSLVWKAPTLVMNPNVPDDEIAKEYENDAISAKSEYGAEFRSDIESFVSREAVEACVVSGCRELMPAVNIKYSGFIDAAGGTGQDSFCLGIAHRDGSIGVLDKLLEVRPPFSTDDVVKEYCETLRSFGIDFIIGDGYAGGFVVEAFAKHGVKLEQSAKRKSAIYAEFLPMLNSKRVKLLDNPKMVTQFAALERTVARGSSRETIDHPPRGGHDDLCNAAAGVLVHLSTKRYKYDSTLNWVISDEEIGQRSGSAQRLSSLLSTRIRGF